MASHSGHSRQNQSDQKSRVRYLGKTEYGALPVKERVGRLVEVLN